MNTRIGLHSKQFNKQVHSIWMMEYLKNCRLLNRSFHTIKNYKTDISSYILWYEANHLGLINQATAKTIEAYKTYLAGQAIKPELLTHRSWVLRAYYRFISFFQRKKCKASSQRHRRTKVLATASKKRHLSSIKNFYEYLKQSNEDENRLFLRNPVRPKLHHITLKDEDQQPTRHLTNRDWLCLEEKIYRPTDRFIIHLLYFGGLRLSELCQLKVSCFNSKDWCIDFIRKGGKIHKLYPEKKGLLFNLFEVHLKKRKFSGEYVFCNKRGKAVSTRTMFAKVLSMFKKAQCPTPGLTPHSFRKACATNLYLKTKDLLYVRDYLNHNDAKVTQLYIDPRVLIQARRIIKPRAKKWVSGG